MQHKIRNSAFAEKPRDTPCKFIIQKRFTQNAAKSRRVWKSDILPCFLNDFEQTSKLNTMLCEFLLVQNIGLLKY